MRTKRKLLSMLIGAALALQTVTFTVSAADKATVAPPEAWGPLPNASQLQYYEEELAAFIHFGVNTFTNKEWGNGRENPNVFNPTDLDTDQWVKSLKDAGFTRIIMIGRHHDGFCLWPSEYTEQDVSNSTDWQKTQNGEGDVLLDLSKSCTKYDMDMGLYLSPWDANNSSYGYGSGTDDATDSNGDYNEYYMNQLKEVFENPKYGNNGKFVEVWMDGAKGSGAAAQHYKFQEWFDLIEELEPGALVFSPYGSTLRWVGNERGNAGDPCWQKIDQSRLQSTYDQGYEEPPYLNAGDPNGDIWSIPETNTSILSGWFWHPGNQPKSMEQLSDIYFKSVGRGTPLLLNIPPDDRGKFTDECIDRIAEFGDTIRHSFAVDFTDEKNVTAEASAVRGNVAEYGAGNVLDNDEDTYWTMNDGQTTGTLTINLAGYRNFDIVSIEEYIKLGQRISDFTVEVHTANGWRPFGEGHTIGAKRLVRSTAVQADQIRIQITGSQAVPLIHNVEVYKADKNFEIPRLIPDGVDTIDNTEFGNKSSWKQEDMGDNDTSMYTSTTGAYATASFTGSKAWIYGTHDSGHGIMEVWIDDQKVADVDTYRPSRKLPALLYTTDDLPYGEHTVKMVVKGEKNPASRGRAVGLDFLAYLDNGGAGMFEMAQDSYTVNEGGVQEIMINRVGGSTGVATVHFSTTPDTAVHGRHYYDVTTDVTFADGQTTAVVPVGTVDNTEVADNLRFYCQLDQPSNGTILGFNASSSVSIRDNDGKIHLETALKQANEKNEGHFISTSWEAFAPIRENAQAVYDSADSTQTQIDKAVADLNAAMDALVARTSFTEDDPFVFPVMNSGSKLFEAEFFTLFPTIPLEKHVRVEDVSGASNGKMVTWFDPGDVIKVPYVAKQSGTYTVTATYRSGRASSDPNKFNWSGEKIQSGSVSVYGPNPNTYKTVEFDIKVTEAGPGELIFTADTSASPNIDKFEIVAKQLNVEKYTIQATAGSGGSISPVGSVEVEQFSDQTFTITPNRGQTVKDVLVNGESVGAVTSYTFSDIEADATIEVAFTREFYTEGDPFYLPESNASASLEAENFELHKISTDKYVRIDNNPGASGGKEVNWFEQGNSISLTYDAPAAGTYTFTARYRSGRLNEATANVFEWGGTNITPGNVRVYGPDSDIFKTISFDVEITKAGPGELVFSTNIDAGPVIDKFDVSRKVAEEADKTILNTVIDKAEALMASEEYKNAILSVQKSFTNALAEAKTVAGSDSATQPQVDAAWVALMTEIHKLGLQQGNKEALQEAYDLYSQLDLENYIDDTAKTTFIQALADAAAMLDNRDAVQSEVDAVTDALVAAADGMTLRGIKTSLEALVNSTLDYDANDYAVGWEAFETARTAANAVIADDNATQDDVDAAFDTLLQAMINLRFKADKEILNKVLQGAKALDLSGYTPESVEKFKAALNAAEKISADESLSKDDQPVVDQALNELNAAIAGLTKADGTPANLSVDGDGNITGASGSAKTGDTAPAAAAAALLLLAGAAATFLRKKHS